MVALTPLGRAALHGGTHSRFCTAMRTKFSSTSASAEIFWTCRNPSMYGRIWEGGGRRERAESTEASA